jgi:hypothetical protein
MSPDMIQALAETTTVQAAADLMSCTAASIHTRAKAETEVKLAIREQGDRVDHTIALAIVQTKGVLSRMIEIVGLPAPSIRYRITQSPMLKQVIFEARESVIDNAEDNIFKKVEAGDYGASVFVVKTLGKDRGYTERREIEGNITHSIDKASTGSLIQMLNELTHKSPEAVEAEFEELPAEDRKLLQETLERHAPENEQEIVEAAG